jgi:hypothetical protein
LVSSLQAFCWAGNMGQSLGTDTPVWSKLALVESFSCQARSAVLGGGTQRFCWLSTLDTPYWMAKGGPFQKAPRSPCHLRRKHCSDVVRVKEPQRHLHQNCYLNPNAF